MKAFAAVLICVASAAAAEVEWPRLIGIVNVTNKPQAVLVMPRLPIPDFWSPAIPQLQARESAGGYEVLSIDPASGTVRLRHIQSSQETDVKLARLEGAQNYSLHFERAPTTAVIDTYQNLSGRTVIHSPQLVHADIDIHIPTLPRAEALAALAKALEAHDLWLIPYADKYAFALPARHKALAESIPPPRPAPAEDLAIPPGLIKFTSADLVHVLDYYMRLSGRTVLHPNNLRGTKVTLSTQTPLSRAEAIWVLEAALRLGALITIPAGDKFAFVVPPGQEKDLPTFDPARQLPGNVGEMNLRDVDRRQFLETYAALVQRKPMPIDETVPNARFSLQTLAPLKPAEAAFALEAVAMLNHLKFELVGDNEVKLVHRASLPGNQKL
jgi:hypothetical protein